MPNKVKTNPETAVVFGSEVGDDVDWSTESIGNGAGRQSATYSRSAFPQATRFLVEFWTQLVATPTLGAAIQVFVKGAGSYTATPDHWANDDTVGDGAVSSIEKLRNLDHVLTIAVDEAAANVEMGAKAIVEIPYRHFALVFWNAAGSATSATASATKARLTPIPYEVQ